MRIAACVFCAAAVWAQPAPVPQPAAPAAKEPVEALGYRWLVPVVADWKAAPELLQLLVPRPSEKPRRPSQYAIAETPPFQSVTIDVEVRKEPKALRNRRNSLILIYAWRDPDHFNYAHISDDNAQRSPHHNGVFHVYGGDRVRISAADGPDTLPEERWYKVRLRHDGSTGRVQVWVDGKTSPSFDAYDLSLRAGKVGLGSFFDTGEFRNLKITGKH